MSSASCVVRQTLVNTVHASPATGPVAAFAVDTPRAGERAPGVGLEINGWAIGLTAPLLGVRAVVNGLPGEVVPLAVSRSDVAADYPGFPHAAASGFSFWAPLPGGAVPWRLSVVAIASDGAAFTMAEMAGSVIAESRQSHKETRPVCAPDFVIIGAQRGGTTSLHAYLNALPNVVSPAKKELHFLTDRHQRGRDWYMGQFPASVPAGVLAGEATPYALFHPVSPDRLRSIAPGAKLIVLLRNPVERAYSQYLLEHSRGDEPLSFAAAIDAEPDRLAGEAERLAADPTYVSAAHNHASYLARGNYAPQLTRWFCHFPREQFLILRSEDLYARTAETLSRVTAFLGLPPSSQIDFARHNRTSGPAMEPALRKRLSRHFAPLNDGLAETLGWDTEWS